MAELARGRVRAHEGAPGEAIAVLRSSCRLWQELGAEHRAACARLALAEAYRELGDEDAAHLGARRRDDGVPATRRPDRSGPAGRLRGSHPCRTA
ncbi:MAG: hypothetical protein U5R31_07735 [Acidimicrobiia bacterium]|nr:hypothetical protein [Acidimicrobiia bacterium]